MGFSACPGCATFDKQHGRIKRDRHVVKTDETSPEVTYALTSLAPDRTSPEQTAALVRNHWQIENRLHHVRDLPRNLAHLTNTAISIVHCQTGFRYVPEANRHFAASQQEALDLLLAPPQR